MTDMRPVDLGRYSFDYDLTLAILLAHPGGHVYHRIGGRTREDPLAWMSMRVIEHVMRETLAEHRAYRPDGDETPAARHTIDDIATFRARLAKRPEQPECIHCHTVHEAQVRDRQSKGTFDRDSVWVWPAPARVGLTMEASDQALVESVGPGSAAAAAGVRAGDRLLRLGTQRVLTVHDIQWVLHSAPGGATGLPLRLRRDGEDVDVRLELAAGWKRTDPLTWSWRPYKWPLQPAPGFGGPLLTAAEKTRLGLDPAAWACRVNYIVDWGDRPQQGRENRKRGLRKGDVVFSYAGRSDFASMDHFHAWTRLRKARGEQVAIGILRGDRRLEIVVTLQ